MCIRRCSLGHRLLCAVCIYKLRLESSGVCYCIMAMSVGSATRDETIQHVYCYSCCNSQERTNMSVVPMAPWVSPSFLLAPCLPWFQQTVWTARQLASRTGSAIKCVQFNWISTTFQTFYLLLVLKDPVFLPLAYSFGGGKEISVNHSWFIIMLWKR